MSKIDKLHLALYAYLYSAQLQSNSLFPDSIMDHSSYERKNVIVKVNANINGYHARTYVHMHVSIM